MKKQGTLIFLLLCSMLIFTACVPQPAITDNAEIVIGTSIRYSDDDLVAAAESIIEDFKLLHDLELYVVKYDEELSLRYEADLSGQREDEIIFFTVDFYASENAHDGWNQDFEYTDFKYVVKRDSPDEDWQAAIYGYP